MDTLRLFRVYKSSGKLFKISIKKGKQNRKRGKKRGKDHVKIKTGRKHYKSEEKRAKEEIRIIKQFFLKISILLNMLSKFGIGRIFKQAV